MSEVFSWGDILGAHMQMMRNQHKPRNICVLVQAAKPCRKSIEDYLEG